ncbi:SDR family NAD(P)-dependent oxidoreductase [Luteimonas aquatica]|uniref:SDR family NAD(P)-dependent oxidoreductase n=1 Tax=Luteimonas aquatica TaxID=450364 RepID=UPI001F56EFDB|nr:SDR family NAD(P)-dependent oxidoreductase [Luteimonas aquatica]
MSAVRADDAAATRDPQAGSALAGRVILVSGAYGGLGRAAALACARAGATLVLLGRKVPRLNRVYDAIRQETTAAEPANYPLDLEGASPDDYAELAARLESGLGRLDGLLHCAAEFKGLASMERTDPADFARAVHVNLTARWWLTQACLPLLKRAEDGAIVFALDDPARTGAAYWGGYGLAQHGGAGLVGMLQAELASTPVRVSGLQPGPMRTVLRSKAYVEEDDRQARDPAAYAEACVRLLSPAGAEHRGAIWAPRA